MCDDKNKYKAMLEDNEILFHFLKTVYSPNYIRYQKACDRVSIDKIIELRKSNLSNNDIARELGLKLSTYQKIVTDYKLPKRINKNRSKDKK